MNKHPKTGDELMAGFIDAIRNVLESYEEKMKYCDNTKQDSKEEKLHYTSKILKTFFNTRGGIPV